MRNAWGDREVAESAALLFDPLKQANLDAVSEFGRGDEPGEILGRLLVAIKDCYPIEYQIAFKRAITRQCKDCEQPPRARGYCRKHYEAHKKVGDFG